MKTMKILLAALALLAMTMGFALADEAPLLLVELPEDAQLVEDVTFDDGDFVQTYQLSGGAYVQLLRYADFDMTIDDLIASEWTGATNVLPVDVAHIGGRVASGMCLDFAEDGQEALHVTLVMVGAGKDTLVYQAVYPQKLGESQIELSVQTMIDSMDVQGGEDGAAVEEVG